MSRPWRFVLPALVFSLSLHPLSAQRDRLTARIDSSRTFVLKGRVHPKARAENDQGPVDGSFQIPAITLLLKSSSSQQSDLQQLLQQQQDPSSANYHRWLTPEQYAERFGVSESDAVRIADWLGSQGFTVAETSRSRGWITFRGTAAQAQNAFHTELHRYNVKGEVHYANATDPAIPSTRISDGRECFEPNARCPPKHLQR